MSIKVTQSTGYDCTSLPLQVYTSCVKNDPQDDMARRMCHVKYPVPPYLL